MNFKSIVLIVSPILFSAATLLARQEGRSVEQVLAPSLSGLYSGGVSGHSLLKFTGGLLDRTGKPVTGVVGIAFAVYKDREGGAPLWMENQNVEANAQGNYSVLLGATTPEGILVDVFSSSEPRWLGVRVLAGESEEQLRVLLVSVPYALKASDADTLGGKPMSAFMLANGTASRASSSEDIGTSSSTDPSRDNSITSAAISGEAGYIAKFTSVDDLGVSALFESGGKVGIGTTSPIDRLQVAGSLRLTDRGDGCCSQFIQADGGRETHFYSTSAGDFQIHKYGAASLAGAALTVTNAGRVGVGTTLPLDRLQISGGSLRVTDRGDGCCSQLIQSANGFETHFYSTSAGDLQIHKYGSGSASGAALTVSNAGRVGVGVTSPGEKLEVAGNVKASSQLISTVATGTAPLAVNSTTQVANLNASFLGGLSSALARTRGIVYLGGCDTCSPLADSDDQKMIYLNVIGPMTVESVTCFSDAGTPSIAIQRNDGSPANILTADLACSPVGASTTAFSSSENILNLNDSVDFILVNAGGVAKRVTLAIRGIIH